MPLYFFSLRDHGNEPDDIGTDLPDGRTARVEAIRCAGAMLRDDPALLDGGRLSVFVTDDAGALCFRMDVHAVDPG